MPNLDVCGIIYPYPNEGDRPWGTEHIDWATAVSACLTNIDTIVQTQVVNPMTAQGDIIFNNAALDPDRLPIGALGQILAVNVSGEPEWTTPSLVSSPLTTDGDIFIRAGGMDTRLPIGVNGQILGVSGGLPVWQAPGAGSGDVVGPVGSLDENVPVFDGTTGKLIKMSGVNIDSSDNIKIPGNIVLDKSTHNYTFSNPDNGNMLIDYNGTTIVYLTGVIPRFVVNGGTPLQVIAENIAVGATPEANTLYTNSFVKAWASTTSGATISDGVNLSVVSGGVGSYNYTFTTPMANNFYVVTGNAQNESDTNLSIHNKTANGFEVRTYDIGSGTDENTNHNIIVVGEQ